MKAIVTGGAGFIGCNAIKRLMAEGWEVVAIDDLSRRGSEKNLSWLQGEGKFTFHRCDVRDARHVSTIVGEHRDADLVLHLAAQVAVTTSVTDPRTDFEVNALGTFNVLEAVRAHAPQTAFLYSSTNKVYGGLEHLAVTETAGRYGYADMVGGVSEREPLDFHSPYGCSKGAADQYVRDYARIYGLRTVVFRQSCIYGYRQFGVEDQGWLAWFTIAAAKGQPITIYGDGKQVRDVLFVEDLVDLYLTATRQIERAAGKVYNVGGGPTNVLSLHDLLGKLDQLSGGKIERRYDEWRPGDQKVFVCDIGKAKAELGWAPKVSAQEGVERLNRWVKDNINLF
jgi:CDP-paratose 2-epimerase